MSAQNLRSSGPVGKGDTKGSDVKNTAMLNTTARPTPAHNDGVNTQGKYTTSHKPYGALGAKGHGGAA